MIDVHVDPERILRRMGLGGDRGARLFLANEVERLSKEYVPMSIVSGAHMVTQSKISDDGSTLTYPGPYAHYQYHGEMMAGTAPKKYTGLDLTYSGDGKRGKEWDKRMMADKGDEVREDLEVYIKGRLR